MTPRPDANSAPTADLAALSSADQAALLLARLERLPISRWHVKARLTMGVATFFDAFDVLAIAYVLPVLAGTWKLTPQKAGLLISASFLGQIFGSLFFGWLAERIGRVRTATITIAEYACFGLLCTLSWSFASLFTLRVIQGFGLGGEVPVAAAYINEISRARGRGRFFLLYEMIYPIGLVTAGILGYFIVPRFGWRVMFLMDAVPALLVFFLIKVLPESPRWLIAHGRFKEAGQVIAQIERGVLDSGRELAPLPPVPASSSSLPAKTTSWAELFRGIYRRRTFVVWGLWIFTYPLTYGINSWLPTIYRTFYHLSVADALRDGLITNALGLIGALACAFTVDRIGRRACFIAAFLLASAPLFLLWWSGARTPGQVILLASLSFVFVTSNSALLFLYTPEIYPTRLRSVGTGSATCLQRLASAVGPGIIGVTLAGYGVPAVFLMLGIIALVGTFIALNATETRERPLEEISP